LKSGMGVRFTKSQDLEARHDRFAALCDAGGYHDVCGCGGRGIELDAVARGVLDDAAGYGWADGAEDGIGAGDGAVGAGVFDDAVMRPDAKSTDKSVCATSSGNGTEGS
jgi:hypothetical protein